MDERVDGESLSLAPDADSPDALDPRLGRFFDHLSAKGRDFVWRYAVRRFPTTARVLELGCGEGVLSEKLIRSGFGVTAVDAAEEALDACRRRLAPLRREAYRVVRAEGAGLPFDDGEFDLALCLGGFGHGAEAQQVLRETHRILRPGGLLILAARNAWTPKVFDLQRLARTCLEAARTTADRVVAVMREAGRPGPELRSAADVGDEGAMHGSVYQDPRRLIRDMARRGYTLADFDGLGYGPLTLGDKPLLSVEAGITVSDVADWACHASRLIWLSRWLAAFGIYVFRRSV